MKIVLDTNVLIAAFIAHGVCHDLLEHCVRWHTLITSEWILGEFSENLRRKFKYTAREAEEAIALLRSGMQIVTPENLEIPVCRDQDDDMVLGTAIAGQASCIVTGDKDLLILRRFRSIDIVSPSDFASYETAREADHAP